MSLTLKESVISGRQPRRENMQMLHILGEKNSGKMYGNLFLRIKFLNICE